MAVDIIYLDGRTNSTSALTSTYTGVNLGTPAADREIIVGVGTNNVTTTGSFYPIGVTLDSGSGPVAMTLDLSSPQSKRIVHVAFFRLLVPSGSTADIVVTKNANSGSRNGIMVWSMTGRGTGVGLAPVATALDYDVDKAFSLPPIEVHDEGALFVFTQRTNGGTATWTGITEDFDANSAADSRTTGGHYEPTADNLAYGVSVAFSSGAGRGNYTLLASYSDGAPIPPASRSAIIFAVNRMVLELIPPVEGGLSETFFTVPSGAISADLDDFVLRVDLADFGTDFWANVTPSGENIRVFSADGEVQYPIDVVQVNRDEETGEIFFKASLASGFDNEFVLRTTEAVSPDGIDTPYGRHAVWSDYEAVFIFTDMFNRVRSGAAATIDGTAAAHAYAPIAVGSDVDSHQGVAYDGTYFYVADTNRIRKYNSSWVLQATNNDPLGDTGTPGVNHIGDVFHKSGEIFSAYEKYPASGGVYNNQHVGVWNASDLSFNRTYDISANGHEVSSITWDPINSYFVITDYTAAGATVLHKYSSTFTYLGTITTAAISQKQGIDYYNNKFWITTAGKKLYTVNLDGSGLTQMWSGSISGYMEGIASKGDGNFYILFDGSPSAIYTFAPASGSGLAGWLNLPGTGNARATVAKLTTWTMGASVIPAAVSANAAVLSYGVSETGNNSRATLAIRTASSKFGIWNSTDTWVDSTGTDPTNGVRARVHHTHATTTNRKIYQAGVQTGNDNTVVQRPAGVGNVLFMGAEDTSYNERLTGALNYVYLRSGELTADWLAAEQDSWEGTGFYTVV